MHELTDREHRRLRVWFEAETLTHGVHLSAALRARGWTSAEVRPARLVPHHGRSWSITATTTPASPGRIQRLEGETEELANRFPGCRYVGSELV